MKKYLFVLRGAIEGIRVSSWHEITEDDDETLAVMFGMTISSKMNMGSGVLKISSEEEWTADLLETYLRTLSPIQLKKFIEECRLAEA